MSDRMASMVQRTIKVLAGFVLFLVGVVSLWSQDGVEYSGPIHRVSRIVLNINGNTRDSAIRRFIDIAEGDEFPSVEELFGVAEREKQDLINYRVFKYIEMTIEDVSHSEDTVDWEITYEVQDSWTLLPIPYPKYDSNRGFRLGLKTFYDNAFGSMTDLYLGLGMDLRIGSSGNLEIGEWQINPAWRRVKIGTLYFDFSLQQEYAEEKFTGVPAYDYSYFQTTIAVGSTIDFVPTQWSYSFTPTFFFRYGYVDRGALGNFRQEPVNFAWNHSIGWGKVDWQGNFRRGQRVDFGHAIRIAYDPTVSGYYVINDFDITGGFYQPFGTIFNYYGRFLAFATANGRRSSVGSYLRGIADDSMSGDFGFVLNTSLGIRFWRLDGVWDAQVHPFFDVGMAVPGSSFDPAQDIRYSAGLDFVLYLDVLPSLVARGSIGVDLGRYSWSEWDKYEITITSTLEY